MRALDATEQYDVIVLWFTVFGMFDDDTSRDLLKRCHRALAPGGRLLVESINRDADGELASTVFPTVKEVRSDQGLEFMIDRSSYSPMEGRVYVERSITRIGAAPRTIEYSI